MRHVLPQGLPVFVVVGAAGFVVDGGLLTVLARTAGWNVFLARALSFTAATVVTWALNRKFAFRVRDAAGQRGKEYTRYLAVQVMGAAINLGCFTALIAIYPELRLIPVVPLFAGALVALGFNYTGARYFVFGRH